MCYALEAIRLVEVFSATTGAMCLHFVEPSYAATSVIGFTVWDLQCCRLADVAVDQVGLWFLKTQ